MARRKNAIVVNAESRQWDLSAGSHVWVYLRHSPGDKQTIESQIDGIQKWCAAQGWIIDRMFIDEGIEGSKEQRPQFQEMIACSRQSPRPVDGIVVWAFSRFARDQLDSQFYKADLRKRGYAVLSFADDIPNNAMAPLIEAFTDWKNQRFLEDMSVDVKRGQLYVVEQGFLANGVPPIGYRAERIQMGLRHSGSVRFGNSLVKDESLAERVALAWRMKLESNASYLTINRETRLYANSQHLSIFFDNLLYAGIYEHNGKWYPQDWESGARFCEPYVSLDEFYRVQEGRKSRTIAVTAPRLLSSPYLLTGLMKCGHCLEKGQKASICGSYHGNYHYYFCISKHGDGQSCALSRMPCWVLDEAVVSLLRSTVLTREFVCAEVERANAQLAENKVSHAEQLAQLIEEASKLKRKVESIIELISEKGLTQILGEQYDAANLAWQQKTTQLAELRAHPVKESPVRITLADAERVLEDLLLTLDNGTVEDRRALMARFIERIIVYPGYAELHWTFDPGVKLLQLDNLGRQVRVGNETPNQGTVNASLVRTAEILKPAIARNCPSIVITHNHPSGDPTPSGEDQRVTEQLYHAAKIMDIALLDHVIIGQGHFVSLRELGIGFPAS